jgi:hypothetical protein
MDSILIENSNFKLKLNELMESSLNNLEKRTILINTELEKIRFEYIEFFKKGYILFIQLIII